MLCLGREDLPGLVKVVMPGELLIELVKDHVHVISGQGICQSMLFAWNV